ncbi:GIY-YIG nuclease family protein [Viridibacillus arvi]|uniref:GIY-YIG nuclease family protein n=1 Tax=Viridibacillus arvi TaxID=263475 RepID=UPI0036E616BC
MFLDILSMLKAQGLDTTKKIKIARNQDPRLDKNTGIHEVYANGEFELYQSYQEQDRFKNCIYLVSCLGMEHSQALFVGVYEVKGKIRVNGFPEDIDVSYQGKSKIDSKYKYDLVKVNGFEELEDRLIIKWDGVPSSWFRYLDEENSKEVIQLLPKGYIREFPGYLDFVLPFRQLKKIMKDPIGNKIWHDSLSALAGIYLIVDNKTGDQYVGSAYGENGILGRWKEYARMGHGGNAMLKELLAIDPNYANNFSFTILQTLPKTLSDIEVIAKEKNYKNKLGTRAFGLNLN